MKLSCILAVAENGVIGAGNRLPWHLPDDLDRFKTLTMGHPIIMGRRTWESIGRPLPGRRSIVLTRGDPEFPPGVEAVPSLEEALKRCGRDEEVFVIGGASVFEEALPRADRLLVTLVHAEVAGDAVFPLERLNAWTLVDSEAHPADDRHAHAFTFQTYERGRV